MVLTLSQSKSAHTFSLRGVRNITSDDVQCLTACLVIQCGLGHHLWVHKGEKQKTSFLLLLHVWSPLLHHTFGGFGTIQTSLRFASMGLLLILMKDCKGGKENRTEHANASLATVRVTQRECHGIQFLQTSYRAVMTLSLEVFSTLILLDSLALLHLGVA